uniref:Uncharacterized protein n=1 Tax=Solanum tuberosum TaxID=4113 RepID=M1B880_SOLTU
MVNTATNDVATVASIPFKPPPLEYSEPKLDLLTCGGYSSNYRNSSSMTGVEVAGASFTPSFPSFPQLPSQASYHCHYRQSPTLFLRTSPKSDTSSNVRCKISLTIADTLSDEADFDL